MASVAPRWVESLRVLVVDDYVAGGHSLENVLSEIGFTARIAHDGLTALEIAAEFRPDYVLLDIVLPILDGCEVARRLRMLPPFRRARIIAVTGLRDYMDRASFLELGFDDHLAKPFSISQLLRTLRPRDQA